MAQDSSLSSLESSRHVRWHRETRPPTPRVLSFASLLPLPFLLLHVSGPCPAQSLFQRLLVSEDPDLEGAPAVLGARGGAQTSYLPAVPSTCLQTGKAPCASSGCPQMGPFVTMYPAGGRLGLTSSQARQLPTPALLLPTTWM